MVVWSWAVSGTPGQQLSHIRSADYEDFFWISRSVGFFGPFSDGRLVFCQSQADDAFDWSSFQWSSELHWDCDQL